MAFNPYATITILENQQLNEEAHFYKELRNLQDLKPECEAFPSQNIPPFYRQSDETNENGSNNSIKLGETRFRRIFRTVEKQKHKKRIQSYILSPKIISKFEEAICVSSTSNVKFDEISWDDLSPYRTYGNGVYLSNEFLDFFVFCDKNNEKYFRVMDYLNFLKLLSKIFFSFLLFEKVDQNVFYNFDSLVSEETLNDFVEVVIKYISGLDALEKHEPYYIVYATSLMMSFLTNYENEKIPIRKLLFSKIFIKFINFDNEESQSLIDNDSNDSLVSQPINPFHPKQCIELYNLFGKLDVSKSGLLRMCDIKTINSHIFTEAFLDRLVHHVFEGAIDNDKLDYILFCRFYLAIKYITAPRSVDLLFSVADIDGDGVISNFDILYFYKEMLKELNIPAEDHSYDAFYSELLDYLNASPKTGITKELIYTTKTGAVFFMLLFDRNTFLSFGEN